MYHEPIDRPQILEPSAAARARYDREVVILEQQAERALCLYHGCLSTLRANSTPWTPAGRKSRKEWLRIVTDYINILTPAPAKHVTLTSQARVTLAQRLESLTNRARSPLQSAIDEDEGAFWDRSGFTKPSVIAPQGEEEPLTFTDEFLALLRTPKALAAILLALILAYALLVTAGAFPPR